MPGITAVELGADTCALARTSVRRGAVRVTAVEALDPAAFPGKDSFTVALRQTRRALRLPRRCRAVIWGLPDGASRKDPTVKPLIAPLVGAGFKIERVVSPCNALAALARLKTARGEGATCWIAINRGGVAIVVVRPGLQLYAHSFLWDSSVGFSGSQALLLQRYSLVAFLLPEIKRAMAVAREKGTPVEAIVTCGNLPDLRSLTMPLIEELDIEVETLDSLDGLVVKAEAADKIGELAPAIRLACAGAIARSTRPWDESKRRSRSRGLAAHLRVAALVGGICAVGYAWYVKSQEPKAPRQKAPVTQQARAQTPPPAVSGSAKKPESNPPAPKSNPPAVSVPAPAVSVPAKKPESNPPAPKTTPAAPAQPKPVVTTPPPVPQKAVSTPPPQPKTTTPPPAVSVPAKKPESNPPAPKSTPAAPAQPKPVVTTPPPVPQKAVSTRPPQPKTTTPPPTVSAPAKKSASTSTTPPHTALQPLVTAPQPNVPAPRAPVTSAAGTGSPAPLLTETPTRTPAVPPPAPKAIPAPARTAPVAPPAVSAPAKKPESIPPRVSAPAKRPESSPAGLNAPPAPADKPDAGSNVRRTPARPMPPLLKDPIPRVTAILVSTDRRFATIEDGHIIAIGDVLGRRTVVEIDQRAVVLREPSGVQIRVALGGRVIGIGLGAAK